MLCKIFSLLRFSAKPSCNTCKTVLQYLQDGFADLVRRFCKVVKPKNSVLGCEIKRFFTDDSSIRYAVQRCGFPRC